MADHPYSSKMHNWAKAERFALMAEEAVRTAFRIHMSGEGPAPSDDMVRRATEYRAAADKLYDELQGVSGS